MQDRIRRGVALLDREVPDWHERVSIDRLNVISDNYCVLGQLFGSYQVGLIALDLVGGVAHGFAPARGDCVSDLEQAWREELARGRPN